MTFKKRKKPKNKVGMAVQFYNPSTQEDKFKASVSYRRQPLSQKKNTDLSNFGNK
jgi:hypothetical protein